MSRAQPTLFEGSRTLLPEAIELTVQFVAAAPSPRASMQQHRPRPHDLVERNRHIDRDGILQPVQRLPIQHGDAPGNRVHNAPGAPVFRADNAVTRSECISGHHFANLHPMLRAVTLKLVFRLSHEATPTADVPLDTIHRDGWIQPLLVR